MKIIAVSIILIMILIPIHSVTSTNGLVDTSIIYDPVVEVADLKQNGTLTDPWIFNLTKDFSAVTKMIWIIDTQDNTLDFNNFDGTSALTNGVEIYYNSISLVGGEPIRTNHDLMHYAYNVEMFSDDVSPKDRIILVQWLLSSFIPDGLQITPTKTITIQIRDDLLSMASLNNFTCTFKGYKNVVVQNKQIGEPFDPIGYLWHIWNESGSAITFLLLFSLGVLMTWYVIKRGR